MSYVTNYFLQLARRIRWMRISIVGLILFGVYFGTKYMMLPKLLPKLKSAVPTILSALPMILIALIAFVLIYHFVLRPVITVLKFFIHPSRPDKKSNDGFYSSKAWRELRYIILANNPKKCMLCGWKGNALHVDHIKPRSKYPELALDIENLQILCKDCNMGKSNKFEDDFR